MKYTLDRIEKDIYIFLEKGNEENQLEILKDLVTTSIVEGDIVEIYNENNIYIFTQLGMEKEIRKNDVQRLIDTLKNK